MKRIFAIFLLVLTLISQSGLVLAGHYCMGDLAEWNLGFTTHAPSCEMAQKSNSCKKMSSTPEDMRKKGCCEDDFFQIKLTDPIQPTVNSEIPVSPIFVAAFISVFQMQFWKSATSKIVFTNYSPPIPDRDIPVLFQTFLI